MHSGLLNTRTFFILSAPHTYVNELEILEKKVKQRSSKESSTLVY